MRKKTKKKLKFKTRYIYYNCYIKRKDKRERERMKKKQLKIFKKFLWSNKVKLKQKKHSVDKRVNLIKKKKNKKHVITRRFSSRAIISFKNRKKNQLKKLVKILFWIREQNNKFCKK